MPALPIALEQAREERWDVVVVGTGMGGSTSGFALAEKGLRVLFIEKGLFLFGGHDRGTGELIEEGEEPQRRLKMGWWPVTVDGDISYAPAVKMFAPLGCGTGGSSSLYAAQLERMHPSDFVPRKHHATATRSSLPEAWPFSYQDLIPYYRRAEKIFDVCGTQDPLNADAEANLRPPPPMSERDGHIFELLQSAGMHPYRAHVGCRYLPGCFDCAARLCPKACKTDAGLVCLLPAVEKHGAAVLAQAEVLRLEASADRVTGVTVRQSGQTATVSGKVVVLAAGALMTPTLLLKSSSELWPKGLANRNDLVGRNLMMHTSDFIAMRPSKTLDARGPGKAISASDLFVRNGRKLGTLQSLGMPVTPGSINAFLRGKAERDPKSLLTLGGTFGRKVASRVGAALFSSANVFASVVEDLPYADNRIVLDPSASNGMRFVYEYPRELLERNELFRKELDKQVGKKLTTLLLGGDNNLNFGHTSGTARAGTDRATSVLDPQQRAHDLDNLYVADGSAFPSSGGINPSLTIAATALRVADAIAQRLGPS
jgi:choline dehydrogenase-like flavoprotein